MLTSETKRHIDAARQVLVGVVPNPTSQIDQITNALIYRFMDDMDQAAIRAGGKPSFFVGELDLYAWTKLMDTRVGNQERMNLYAEALIKFSEAKQLPELFRSIFKSAFLPYRSPEVLGLFLKEINYFSYSHSEELGNAYEYLLSIMSSQGDAGQFRTPRHIIDFIVDVINPTKDDKILDPACGTGGFLVSSFKHILEQHDGKNDLKKKEIPLTPEQKRGLMNNIEGYDIDPGMVPIAQVNMYLHQFKNPKIYNYDTLSNEEYWNKKFDVILANPPFMSPKGGIKPHGKFSIESSRSEVLFVDFIMSHLRPKGRAGIIVPEGIIFQSGSSYKQLRKNLVLDGLYAVVSLPSGVFQPYSGVKTSILFFDNEVASRKADILFVKIDNDGFDLGAQRRKNDKDDLPKALEILKKWKIGKSVESKLAVYVERSKIADTGDYNLSGDRYRVVTDYSNAKWPMVNFDDVVSTLTPPAKIPKEHFKAMGSFPIIDQSQDEIAGWTEDEATLVKSKKPLVIFGDHTCAVKYTDKSFAQGADGIKILLTNDQLIPKYFYYILKKNPVESEGYHRHFAKLKRYKIPLPPLEIQEQIVKDLDSYQKIISGAKQIVDNWKPKIDIDPKWKKVKLGDVCNVYGGGTPSRSNEHFWGGSIPWISSRYFPDDHRILGAQMITEEGLKNSSTKIAPKGSTILITRVSVGKFAIADKNYAINQDLTALVPKNDSLNEGYLWLISEIVADKVKENAVGVGVTGVTRDFVVNQEIPLPSLKAQRQIVEKIEAERTFVESPKKLIEIYDQKTKEVIAKLWDNKEVL